MQLLLGRYVDNEKMIAVYRRLYLVSKMALTTNKTNSCMEEHVALTE